MVDTDQSSTAFAAAPTTVTISDTSNDAVNVAAGDDTLDFETPLGVEEISLISDDEDQQQQQQRPRQQKQQQQQQQHVCVICGSFKAAWRDDLIVHIMAHVDDVKECDYCAIKFDTTKQMSDHFVKDHGGFDKKSCPHCSKSFWLDRDLRRHIERSHK